MDLSASLLATFPCIQPSISGSKRIQRVVYFVDDFWKEKKFHFKEHDTALLIHFEMLLWSSKTGPFTGQKRVVAPFREAPSRATLFEAGLHPVDNMNSKKNQLNKMQSGAIPP